MKDVSKLIIFGFGGIILLLAITAILLPITNTPITGDSQSKGENKMPSLFEIKISGGKIHEQLISESIPAKAETGIDISHSHGNVTVRGWDKDEVKIEGKKIVSARDEETARMYAEMMKIEISSDGDKIVVSAIRPERDRSWKINQITINYELYAPKRLNVTLKNIHGNVTVEGFMGNLDMNCRHGDLQASQIGKDVVIVHEHGKNKIHEIMGKVSVNKKHGDLNVQSVGGGLKLAHEHGAVVLDMIREGADLKKWHGDLDANNMVGNLRLEHEHGYLKLGTIRGNTEISKQHGNINIEIVKGNLSIQSDHGNLKIIGVEGNVYLRGSHGNAHVENVSGFADVMRSHCKTSLNNVNQVVQH